MNERTDMRRTPGIEEALDRLYAAPTPDPSFVEGLEGRLLSQWEREMPPQDASPGAARGSVWRWLTGSLSAHRWATAALALLLALSTMVAAIGPQRVWADLQRLVGFVPGLGMVDMTSSRILSAPLETTRQGVTVIVQEVVAKEDSTVVVLEFTGLPEGREKDDPASDQARREAVMRLRLPDGTALSTNGWASTEGSQGGSAVLGFPPLPEGVFQVTLEISHLPITPVELDPGQWVIPLTLVEAEDQAIKGNLEQPLEIVGAEQTVNGYTLSVRRIIRTPERTVLGVQIDWPEGRQTPLWDARGLKAPELRDDLGNVYALVSDAISVQFPDPRERSLVFPPVDPAATRLTLHLDGIQHSHPADGGFTVDLGDDPQIGDTWPLDIHTEVGQLPLRILSAELMQRETARGIQTDLGFALEPIEQDGRLLLQLQLGINSPVFDGGAGYGYSTQEDGISDVYATISLKDGDPLPSGKVDIVVRNATVLVFGPWDITWDLPQD